MVNKTRRKNRKDVNKRIDEGCGQGRGIDYKPAIHISDFSSKGSSLQSLGWKTRREHHLLSQIESDYFYLLEWSPIVIDIREQFPLDIKETLLIAEQCGYNHPVNPNTGEPNVMTTDFVITIQGTANVGILDQARTVKPSDKLQEKRTLEKLEIERRYWKSRNIDWGIVTEQEIPKILVKNIGLLHDCFFIEDLLPLSEILISQITTLLTKGVSEKKVSLINLTSECDYKLGLEPGNSVRVVRHLIANRKWLIDMSELLETQFRTELKFLVNPTLNFDKERNYG
ncbi:TnsA endonuclease N-terminal domain-containing protein [Nostoc sp. FACHB-280]|uniref:TnsA endonuclease N-terminal domain-containing protein n=1 Tax=Nostoc sp. FACHB-280 TaxID=2692839 RepID=UPI0018EFE1AE|nr:TnsA endonuclease N-terminal domain-containing protein [Nostoc sp. FACHB-280]